MRIGMVKNKGGIMCSNIYFYVVCVASFRKEMNHGVWIDATLPMKQIRSEIEGMLLTSVFEKATQWRIIYFDTPYPFQFLNDETSLNAVHNMALFIEAHGDKGAQLLAHFDGDVIEAQEALERRYCGQFPSGEIFMQHQISVEYPIPDWLSDCIDYRAAWRNRSRYAYFYVPAKPKGIHVFRR